jgi:hypothetical protein
MKTQLTHRLIKEIVSRLESKGLSASPEVIKTIHQAVVEKVADDVRYELLQLKGEHRQHQKDLFAEYQQAEGGYRQYMQEEYEATGGVVLGVQYAIEQLEL